MLPLKAGPPPSPQGQSGTVHFTDSGQALGGNAYSYDVALGDLDGDGDLDAFVANTWDGVSSRTNIIWVNQGGAQGGVPGVFADSGQNLGAESGVAVALGDVDGDADLDAFVLNDGLPAKIWLNSGGLFTDSGQSLVVDLGLAVALGDLDGDSDLDAFVVGNVGRADTVWLNQGGDQGGAPGVFVDSGQTLGPGGNTAVSLGDVDNDGDLDALVGDFGGSTLWLNQGGLQGGAAGVFAQGTTLGSANSLAVVLADLDGDAALDAFLANDGPDQVWLQQGGVLANSGQSLGNAASRGVALADLDGDADLDAFVSVTGPNLVWLNQGGVFSSSGLALGSAASEAVALGDLDGDGAIDAFVANWGAPNKVWLNQTAPPDPQADLMVQASGPVAINIAGTNLVDHKATVTNLGPVTATNVSLTLDTSRIHEISSINDAFGRCFPPNDGEICSYPFFGSGVNHSVNIEYSVVAMNNSVDIYRGGVTSQFSVNSDTTDPNPGNNWAQVGTDIYDCDMAACWLEEFFCVLSFPASSMRSDSSGLISQAIAATQVAFDLPLYYRVRDEILAGSPNGQHYTDLYYTHNAEITTLVLSNTTVMSQALQTIQIWEPNLRALVEGQGDSATITAAQIQAMDDFLQTMSALGSPALQAAITEERAKLPALNTFVGMSMAQARSSVVGYGVYLPVILK
ncbi:hypothetical protein RY27_02700 [Litorilinea aerophila]|nr:hypothetical protein RY27_02700 [Litorilinea aerophila]